MLIGGPYGEMELGSTCTTRWPKDLPDKGGESGRVVSLPRPAARLTHFYFPVTTFIVTNGDIPLSRTRRCLVLGT